MKHLKQNKISLVVLAIAVIAILISVNKNLSFADSSSTPGSSEDPVVTKSYVDQQIAKIITQGSGGESGSTGGAAQTGTMAPIEVVKIPLGKSLMVKAGGELIVRAGRAVAVSSDTNGLSDMTDGVDIAPGKPVGNNHLILFPRDGRGVKHNPASKAELMVLVRGGYELK